MKNLYGHGHNATKTDWYSIWDPPNTAPQLFWELDKKHHNFLRERLASAYSMSSVHKYEVHIQACLDFLVRKLKKYAQNGETVDMAIWTNAFTFGVVGELGYGSQFGHLEQEKDAGIAAKSNSSGAGADTTSIGMRTCLFHLAAIPEVQAKLREEIDTFYDVNDLKAPMSYLEPHKLPYLQAVIKEAIRLLPSIVFQLLRHTPPDFKVRGIKVLVNTTIGISPMAQNRDWVQMQTSSARADGENEDKTRYFDCSTMTFGGSGPIMCIGSNIALVELHKFVAQPVHNFDFELVNKNIPWRIKAY
ncbi:cytochrome P450 [Colletotrichum acutatum]|uniref:Cytochrome P450 n=1 Tax=Glomerella acutata TaxID=27357 RepID=A0AAD8URS4_GLOAC|nr:cytochrome P450 [Colletotrichum acutatum]KAK1726533.1 cytochrome P450 [Colletotrichum acutatum]